MGSNIAIALKIQGEKVTNEKINAILDKVDLSDYGKESQTNYLVVKSSVLRLLEHL